MVNGPDGIGMIHPTSIGGEVWYLDTNPGDDPRFNMPSQILGDYSIGFQSGEESPTMTVETSTGYSPGSVIRNISHSFLDSTGYMYKSNDFRDVEITGYFEASAVFSPLLRIQMMARGAELPPNTTQWCPGSCYIGELTLDGLFRWVKGQYHLSQTAKDWIQASQVQLGTDLKAIGWFGLKLIIANMDAGDGKEGVRLEAYVDPLDNNTWKLITGSQIIDIGGWGLDGGVCGGREDQIITWGGPLVTFRFEQGAALKWKKLSVREIDYRGQFLDPAPTRQAHAFAAAARVLTSTRHLYRIGTFIAPTCIGEVPTDPDPPTDPTDPPPGGFEDKTKKIGHKYDINKARVEVITSSALVSAAVSAGTVEAPESE